MEKIMSKAKLSTASVLETSKKSDIELTEKELGKLQPQQPNPKNVSYCAVLLQRLPEL
jgi:hypothetical protein